MSFFLFKLFFFCTDHGLHGCSGDHELHLLSQHGGRRLLLDQVVPAVDLQLGLQVSRRVEVFAVLSRAASLKTKNTQKRKKSWKNFSKQNLKRYAKAGSINIYTERKKITRATLCQSSGTEASGLSVKKHFFSHFKRLKKKKNCV